MKVKVLTHAPGDYSRERRQDLPKMHFNSDPSLHPFEKAREMTRALNAVKMERLFAKPFLCSLEGHRDGVYTMGKHYRELSALVSGAADGEIRLWNLSTPKQSVWVKKEAHDAFVRGVCFTQARHSTRVLSCSDDKTVKLWDSLKESSTEPICIRKYLGESAFTSVDHHYHATLFATSGSAVHIWNEERSEPIQTFEWGHDTLTTVKFNVVETNILAAAANDRSILLYDLRMSSPLSKVILAMRTNAIAWNPMEPLNFTVANEDHCCYTFDMRRLNAASNVLKDHVSAVLTLDYSPTGEELVTGAYDCSMRIYASRSGHSRDIYHTKRMQKVFSVLFSMDAKFTLSGSDDGNIRLWRASASERLGYQNARQRSAIQYAHSLVQKYGNIPEIKRIAKHRHVPKSISAAAKKRRIMEAAEKRKEERRRKHTRPSAMPPAVNQRKLPIVTVEK